MKTKRYLLMLLVMLWCVTGAWAQESTKRHITGMKSAAPYEYSDFNNALDSNPHNHDFSEGDCSCGMPHPHQLNSEGDCTVSGCNYNTEDIFGYLTPVEDVDARNGYTTAHYVMFDSKTVQRGWSTDDMKLGSATFKTAGPARINGYSFYYDVAPYDINAFDRCLIPKTWSLYGLDENGQWVLIHTLTGASIKRGWNSFRFENTDGPLYTFFKFQVTSFDTNGRWFLAWISEFVVEASTAYHIHKYSDKWYSDDNRHWHKCVMPYGECDEPIRDLSEHIHSTFSACCDECDYVNEHEHDWSSVTHCAKCSLQHEHHGSKRNPYGCAVEGCDYNFGDLDGYIIPVEQINNFSYTGNDINALFNGNVGTWRCVPNPAIGNPAIIFRTKEPVRINGYSIDFDVFPILGWTIYGKSAFGKWEVIHSLSTQPEPLELQNYRFVNNKGPLYSEFKFEITSYDQRYSSFELRTLTLDVMHEHDYVRRSDGEKHWLECVSKSGICKEKTKDVENHSIHESILCDTENYTCDVCGYVDESVKAPYDARDYFSLKAMDGDVTLGMKKTGSPDDCLLQVSTDGNIWSAPMTLSETTASIATIPSGETRYFRRGSTTATDKISSEYFDNYWSFTMDGSGNLEADGNIMSLLDMTCQQTTMTDNAFTKLFEGCTQLKKVTINSQALMDANNEMGVVFGNYVTTYVIGNSVTSICDNAFSTNSTVTSVTISEGVRQIGAQAFVQCNGLTSVVIPSTVQNIGDLAFGRCRNIIEFTMNCPSTCSFGSNALSGASDYKIIVPALTTHSWTSNPMWDTYGSHFTEPDFTLHANQDPDNAGNYYTTFYNSHYAYNLPEGVKAYTATIAEEDDEKVVKLTAIEGPSTSSGQAILPKGVAVLLHSNTTGDILMTVSDVNGNEPAMNLFSGVDAETAQTGTNYMLSYGQKGLGFYLMKENMMLSANKAFLPQSAAMANAPAFRMVFEEDEEDGISPLPASPEGEVMIYNLSGMRLDKLQKGINIVNGKKIIVK